LPDNLNLGILDPGILQRFLTGLGNIVTSTGAAADAYYTAIGAYDYNATGHHITFNEWLTKIILVLSFKLIRVMSMHYILMPVIWDFGEECTKKLHPEILHIMYLTIMMMMLFLQGSLP